MTSLIDGLFQTQLKSELFPFLAMTGHEYLRNLFARKQRRGMKLANRKNIWEADLQKYNDMVKFS